MVVDMYNDGRMLEVASAAGGTVTECGWWHGRNGWRHFLAPLLEGTSRCEICTIYAEHDGASLTLNADVLFDLLYQHDYIRITTTTATDGSSTA